MSSQVVKRYAVFVYVRVARQPGLDPWEFARKPRWGLRKREMLAACKLALSWLREEAGYYVNR